MITQQIIQQTRAFARQDGFFLSLVWIASFIGAMLAHKWPSLSFISFIFAISTPFVVSYTLNSSAIKHWMGSFHLDELGFMQWKHISMLP